MHEIAEAGSNTLTHLVLATAGLAKVSHGTQLCIDWSTAEPTIVEVSNGLGGILFSAKLNVDVADEMIAQVVADVHLFNLAVP